jgi:hypothetical protein
MAAEKNVKNDPADTYFKEDLSIDTTFDPCLFSGDTPCKS